MTTIIASKAKTAPTKAKAKTTPSRAKTAPIKADRAGIDYILVDGKKVVFADIDAQVACINVADAELLLQRNETNRPVSQANLTKLTTDVVNGDFKYNGASIVLSTDGCLLDGQHRLLVIVRTGVPLYAVIATGVDVAAQRDMDSGRIRTLTENLTMQGESYAPVLSAVLVGIQAWELGERSSASTSRGVTINTSFHFLDAHPETRQIAKEAYYLGTKINGFGAKALGQLIWAFDKINVNDRIAFFNKLATGEALDQGDAILQLRNFLFNDSKSAAKVNAYYRSAMLIKAWNQWRDGDRKTKLSFRPGGAKPEAFPEAQ